MSRARVTLSDLASELQLSTCTVSKILNRSFAGASYSAETIRRVEACARKRGYAVNAQARSLRLRRTMMVGFLLPSARVATFGALTDQLELELRQHGYQLLISHSRNDPEAEPGLVSSLIGRGIDALIWIPSRDRVEPKEVGLKPGFPVVILDRPECTRAVPFVATDNRVASRQLAERIAAMGHRRVVVFNAPEGDRSLMERCDGLRDTFGDRLTVVDLPHQAEAAREAVGKLADPGSQTARPTVLVALSEPLAIGAIAGMRDHGLRIPEDVSFAAFDDFPLAAHWSPRITAVRQDIAALARESVALLLRRIAAPGEAFADVRVGAEIRWRESVRALPARRSGQKRASKTLSTCQPPPGGDEFTPLWNH